MENNPQEIALSKIDYEKITIDENPTWSQSSLKIIDDCPKQYFISKILKIPRKAIPNMIRGDIFHRLIEKFWKEKNGIYVPVPKYKDEDSFAGVVRARIAYFRKKGLEKGILKEGYIDKETLSILWSNHFIKESEEMARLIYRRYTTDEEKEKVATGKRKTEVSLEGKIIINGQEIKYSTKIDELLPPLIIRDHKTGYLNIPSEFLEKDLQFSFYAFSLWSELQQKNSKLKNFYGEYSNMTLEEFLENLEIQIHHIPPILRIKEKNENKIPTESLILSSKRNLSNIHDLFRIILAKLEIIKKRNFHITTNTSICTYNCGYREICDKINPEEILEKIEEEQNKKIPLFNVQVLESQSHETKKSSEKQKRFRWKNIKKPNN